MASNGHTLRSHIDGSLVMRSFLGGNAGQFVDDRVSKTTCIMCACEF